MKLPDFRILNWLPTHALSFLAAIFLLASTTLAAKTGTFLLMSSKEYKHVPYKVQGQFKVVEIIVDSAKINLSYTDIAAIYDSSGVDITHKTIGRTARVPEILSSGKDSTKTEVKAATDSAALPQAAAPSDSASNSNAQSQSIQPQSKPEPAATLQQTSEPWVSKKEPAYKEGQKSKWSILFSTLGSYTIPTGDYYEGINGGIGFEGEILIPVTREIGIGAVVGNARLQTDFDNVDISSWKFLFLIDYLVETNNRKNLVYLSTGAGATSLSSSEGDLQKTNFTLPFKVGIMLPLGQTVGLNLGAGYDVSFVPGYDDEGNDAAATAFEINFRAGVTFAIPRKSK